MTRPQAIQYAVETIPEILPLEESDVRSLCDQVLKAGGSNLESVAERFLEILGHDDKSFEFVIAFNDLLASPGVSKEQSQPGKKLQPKSPSLDKTVKPEPAAKKMPPLVPLPKTTYKKHSNVKAKPTKTKNDSKTKKAQLLKEIDEVWKFLELEHSERDVAKYACNCQGNRHPLFEAAPNCLSCGKIICIREGLHLSNCSFCNEDLIPLEERLKIVELLKKEKEELNSGSKKQEIVESPRYNSRRKYANSFKISSGMGTNLFSEQDKLFDLIEKHREREKKREEVLRDREDCERREIESQKVKENQEDLDPELSAAQDRLDTLLHFQDTSAERTKIIDNASDFSMSNESGLWGSARERALILKKQQRNLRKWEKIERERNGKRDKYVVSMDIGLDGKVTMKEVNKDNGKTTAGSDEDVDELTDEEDIKDLNDIRYLKGEIESRKDTDNSVLQSKVWDYKLDKKQFARPEYIDSQAKDTNGKDTEAHSDNEWKPRVQVDENDENFWDKIA